MHEAQHYVIFSNSPAILSLLAPKIFQSNLLSNTLNLSMGERSSFTTIQMQQITVLYVLTLNCFGKMGHKIFLK